MRRGALWLLAGVVFAPYPIVAFYPFTFETPKVYRNRAVRDGETARFDGHGLLATPGPPGWIARAAAGEPVTIDLEVATAAVDQHGPARILTVSRGRRARNLTVAQEGDDLVVWLRTRDGNRNGRPVMTAHRVFEAGTTRRIAVALGPSGMRLDVDGKLRMRRRLPPGALTTWDPTMRLALGNEIGAPFPWRGAVTRARVTAAGRTIDYLAPGRLERPALIWYVGAEGARLALVSGGTIDATMNLFGFVPLGLILAALFARQPTRAMIAVAATSLAIECAQVFIPGRFPSVADFLLNVAGGAAGIALALALRRVLWRRGGAIPYRDP